jgi:hypothetical protein
MCRTWGEMVCALASRATQSLGAPLAWFCEYRPCVGRVPMMWTLHSAALSSLLLSFLILADTSIHRLCSPAPFPPPFPGYSSSWANKNASPACPPQPMLRIFFAPCPYRLRSTCRSWVALLVRRTCIPFSFLAGPDTFEGHTLRSTKLPVDKSQCCPFCAGAERVCGDDALHGRKCGCAFATLALALRALAS